MKVLRVKKFPLYDVFTGEGWYNWSRVLVRDTPRVVAGEQLPQVRLNEVAQEIKKK